MAVDSPLDSQSSDSSLAFEDYSFYSQLSDDELLQLAIERSLTDDPSPPWQPESTLQPEFASYGTNRQESFESANRSTKQTEPTQPSPETSHPPVPLRTTVPTIPLWKNPPTRRCCMPPPPPKTHQNYSTILQCTLVL